MTELSQFSTDRTYPGRWTVTLSNPPINMFLPTAIVELSALMSDLEADPSVKVVVFQSANPDFFVAHLDVGKAAERPEALGLWRDFVLRLSSAPVVSIAKIRGRTRGIGNEFVLACDMRFASSGGRTTMTGMHRSTDRRPKSADAAAAPRRRTASARSA